MSDPLLQEALARVRDLMGHGADVDVLKSAYDLLVRLITPGSDWRRPAIEQAPEGGILLGYYGGLCDVELYIQPAMAKRVRLMSCPRCRCCETIWVFVQGRSPQESHWTVCCAGQCDEVTGLHEARPDHESAR